MANPLPENENLRTAGRVIDQRQQQIDPAGRHRVDQNDAASKREHASRRETADDEAAPDDPSMKPRPFLEGADIPAKPSPQR